MDQNGAQEIPRRILIHEYTNILLTIYDIPLSTDTFLSTVNLYWYHMYFVPGTWYQTHEATTPNATKNR